MKGRLFGFAVLSIILVPMFVLVSGCGSGSTGGGSAVPKIVTVFSGTPKSSLIGLAMNGPDVFVVFAKNSPLNTMVYKSTNTAESFSLVTEESNYNNGHVRATVTSDGLLCVGYKQYDSTYYLGGATMDATSGTSLNSFRALSGSTVQGTLDIARYDDVVFIPFTDYDNKKIRFIFGHNPNTPSDIQPVVGNTLNEGGIAGAIAGTTTGEVVYVDSINVGGSAEVVFTRSDDAGATWPTKVLIASSTEGIQYQNVDIVAYDSYTMVSYFKPNSLNDSSGKIYAKYSENYGQTWISKEVSSAYDDMTSVGFSDHYALIAFTRRNGSNVELCVARTDNPSSAWEVIPLVTINGLNELYPELQVGDDETTICVAYKTGSGVFLLRSLDEGNSWNR